MIMNSDITACKGIDCPINKRNKCYRFRIIPSEYQSYFIDTPYDGGTKSCEYFWRIKGPTITKLKRKDEKAKTIP